MPEASFCLVSGRQALLTRHGVKANALGLNVLTLHTCFCDISGRRFLSVKYRLLGELTKIKV